MVLILFKELFSFQNNLVPLPLKVYLAYYM